MPTRQSLPQNYLLNQGITLTDFEDINDFTISPGSGEENFTQYRTGTKSLKLTTVYSGYVIATKVIDLDFRETNLFSFWVYLHSTASTAWDLWLEISSTTDWSKRMSREFPCNVWLYPNQWVKVSSQKDDFVSFGGESWNNQMIRLRFKVGANAGTTMIASFDDLRYNFEGLPRLVIGFDDGWKNDFGDGDTAYSYMTNRGLRGTLYQIRSWVDLGGSYHSLSDLQTLYDQGWAIANHTVSHLNLTTLPASAILTEIQDCTDWLIANGMPRAAYHLAYPLGAWNDAVLTAMAGTGMLSGRTVVSQYQPTPMGNYHLISCKLPQNTTTLATVKSWIDQCIRQQTTLHLCFHRILASPSSSMEWSITNYKALIDYIVARKIKCVTIDEWYQGLTNPRTGRYH